MRLRSITVALAVVPAVLSCALLRHQQVIPDDISGTYRRTHVIKVVTDDGLEDSTVTDSLALSLEKDGSLRFSFELVFDNWHTCAMEGIASRVGEFFEYRAPIEDSNTSAVECVLRIRPTAAAIGLEDIDRACGWGAGYCGVRGRIDGAIFSRTH